MYMGFRTPTSIKEFPRTPEDIMGDSFLRRCLLPKYVGHDAIVSPYALNSADIRSRSNEGENDLPFDYLLVENHKSYSVVFNTSPRLASFSNWNFRRAILEKWLKKILFAIPQRARRFRKEFTARYSQCFSQS